MFLGTKCWVRILKGQETSTAGADVQLRERHVARLAAGAPVDAGPVQPAVLGDPEPLLQELAVPFQRFQPLVVQESEPAPVQEQVQVQVSFPKAPPEEVQAILAVVLAEPVAIPQPSRLLGEALRFLQEILRVSLARPVPQPVPFSGTVVLPKSLCDNAGATLLRLWSHGVPGGAQELACEIQDEVAEPNALSLE